MKLKDNSVRMRDLQPQTALAAMIVNSLLPTFGFKDIVITSLNDGTHMKDSLHYKGCAIDFRTHDWTPPRISLEPTLLRKDELEKVRLSVKGALGVDFDVIIEDSDGPNEHMHVEYQPKDIVS